MCRNQQEAIVQAVVATHDRVDTLERALVSYQESIRVKQHNSVPATDLASCDWPRLIYNRKPVTKELIAKSAHLRDTLNTDLTTELWPSVSISPLGLAVCYHPAAINTLLELGARIEWCLPEESWTLLHLAAHFHQAQSMKILLQHPEGRDMVGERDRHGRTPLELALHYQKTAYDFSKYDLVISMLKSVHDEPIASKLEPTRERIV